MYEDTSKEKLTNLAGIEEAVQSQMQKQAQPLASTLTCIGDRHDGIWKSINQLAPDVQRREILD